MNILEYWKSVIQSFSKEQIIAIYIALVIFYGIDAIISEIISKILKRP